MTNLRTHCVGNQDRLAETLASTVADRLRDGLTQRGHATLVVSGGSTPKPFFKALSMHALGWENVVVTLADERCVEPEDNQSNARLVKENLLLNNAANAQFVSLFDGGTPSQASAEQATERLAALPTYDVVILGMGNDGHTASIFPKSTDRDLALDPSTKGALLIDPVTVSPLRITQTAARLLDTGFLALHFVGADKAELFQKITEYPDEKRWPIAHFIRQQDVLLDVFTDISN